MTVRRVTTGRTVADSADHDVVRGGFPLSVGVLALILLLSTALCSTQELPGTMMEHW